LADKDLLEQITRRSSGICLYGLAPPKQATAPDKIAEIVAAQVDRIRALGPDGLIVYDIQDESDRNRAPRPFPFLPTLDPEAYAFEQLAALTIPKIVYRSVARSAAADFGGWCGAQAAAPGPRFSVLVGASTSRGERPALRLEEAYRIVAATAPQLTLGGIAIAERHAVKGDEHERMIDKAAAGCRFFVTQAVYDVSSTKSMLSDYHHALAARGLPPLPVILTFSPCGSPKTLELMRWLGISIPRWLENELIHDRDILERSVRLCTEICAEIVAFARDKRLPVGINVESIAIRRAEIDAATELFQRLRGLLGQSAP
jgi:Methylenetetrahydrofolate reductase